jgi:hypothetical protein
VEAGLYPHLMIWAKRKEPFLDSALDWLLEMCSRAPELHSVLLDCEGHWHRGTLDKEEAANMVGNRLADIKVGVTGLTKLHPTVLPVAECADYVVPQAYSFWKPGGAHWSHSRSTFPQTMQATAELSWSLENADLIMGLGCYWAGRPVQGLTPKLEPIQTMRASAIETVALGVDTAWYWSLKWARAKSAHGRQVRQFFGARP